MRYAIVNVERKYYALIHIENTLVDEGSNGIGTLLLHNGLDKKITTHLHHLLKRPRAVGRKEPRKQVPTVTVYYGELF